MFTLRSLACLGACSTTLLVLAVDGAAQCPPPVALTSGVSTTASSSVTHFSVTPPNGFRWSAVGIRASDGQDWNLEALDNTAAFPTCYTGALTNSSLPSGIDFAVTDWHFRASDTDFVRVTTPGGTGVSARIQFEQIFYENFPNRPSNQLFVTANDVLKVQEATLLAGARYWFDIKPSAGLTGLTFHLFAPVASGSGWVPKSGRVLEQALTAGTINRIEYTASFGGSYGIVVTNESGLAGDFYIAVRQCPVGSTNLPDNFPVFTVDAEYWPGFTSVAGRWGVVAVRGAPLSPYNFDVAPGFRNTTGPPMACTDSVLVEQSSGLGTRIIAGDFRNLPSRFYTMHASVEAQPKTFAEAYIEFEDGQDSLVVNAPPTVVTPPANNVIDTWGVYCVQGGTYNFQLTPNGGATASYKMMILGNTFPEGTPYWATRLNALGEDPSYLSFGVGQTGLYAVVVVNDNNGTGGYSIQVTSTLTDAGPGPFPATGPSRILGITPNPSAGATRIDYEIGRAGRASLRVSDVSGRVVADLALNSRAGTLTWDGYANGARPAAGVYFVALCIDGVPQGSSKMIVVR